MNENKGLLETIKCNECDSLMRKSMIDYKEEYDSEIISINNVEGYLCHKCGNQIPTEESIKYINDLIHLEKVKIKAEILKKQEYILVNNLSNIRQGIGLSQKDLANFLDSAEQRLGVIERNTNTPTIIVEHLIASFLGVKTDDLYEMVFISPELYNKLLNIELIDHGNGNYKFKHVPTIAKVREEIWEKREELKNSNAQKIRLRNMIKTEKIDRDEGLAQIEALDSKIEEIKKIKDDKKNGLEKRLKKLEGKHSMIIKQERVIDKDTWEKVITSFSEYF